MYNGWLINWVILFKIEKWKVIGYDILLKKKILRKFNENWIKELKWFRYDNEK